MASGHIAVIDIGKTNKKVLIFDANLKIIDRAYTSFEEVVEGKVHLEPIAPMVEWLKEQLTKFAKMYIIDVISITTHGATVMCIDNEGNLATPPVAYTTEAGDDFRRTFYEKFGSPEELQQTTASAEIGSLINVAKKVFYIQQNYPEQFANVYRILFYPQFFGYLLTNKIGAEPTMIGCHTYLYDYENRSWSSVANKMGILDKLPADIKKSWEILGSVTPQIAEETGLSQDCIVTMGIHDSNSSLLPYLIKGFNNFVLNSTGTWCVAMHPMEQVAFAADEIGKLLFYNFDPFFRPIKTSIFPGGLEFETYTDILKKINDKDGFPAFNESVYTTIIREKNLFILPSILKGTGLFPNSVARVIENGTSYLLEDIENGKKIPSLFHDYERAYAALNISLAIQTYLALKATGYQDGGQIFTEGGFRKNDAYTAILSALFPKSTISLTKLEEATAFGAAILGKAAIDGTTPNEMKDYFEIKQIPMTPPSLEGIDSYIEEFVRLVNSEG